MRFIERVEDQITGIAKQIGNVSAKALQLIIPPEKASQETDAQSRWLQDIGLEQLPDWSKVEGGHWDELKWKQNPNPTSYINEMLSGEFEIAQAREDEIETFFRKMKLRSTLYGREQNQSLYLPIHAYSVFLQAVHILEKGTFLGAVIVGPPGIGKSFGLRWALLILAKMEKVVLLEDAKEKTGYLFVSCFSGNYAAYFLSGFDSSRCEAL